jgi:hypothetical protein
MIWAEFPSRRTIHRGRKLQAPTFQSKQDASLFNAVQVQRICLMDVCSDVNLPDENIHITDTNKERLLDARMEDGLEANVEKTE